MQRPTPHQERPVLATERAAGPQSGEDVRDDTGYQAR